MKLKRVNFKKLAAIGMMGIAFGYSAQAALTTNMVGDASFDDNPVDVGLGYSYWNGAPDTAWLSDGSWWYNSGYDSGRRPTPRTGNQALHGGGSYAWQEVTDVFEAGRTYTLSLWTQGDSDSAGAGSDGSDTIWLYIYDGTVGSTESNLTFVGLNQDGTFVDGTNSEDAGPFSGFNRSGGSEWTQVSLSYTVVEGAPEIGQPIGIGFYGRGDAAFDDVMLTTFTPDPGSPPAITSEPQNQEVIIGDPAGATFSVAAVGDAPLAYQWYLDASPVSGGTNSSLTITNVGAAEIGDYSAIITNAFGSDTSQTASLSVTIPDIDPAAQTVVFGGTANFAITLPGTGYAYQWTLDGGDIGGATAGELALVGALQSDTGEYAVVVSSGGVSLTSEVATLDVTVPEVDPAAKVGLVGDVIDLAVAVPGTGYGFQWKKGGINLAGETSQTLTLSPIALSDTGDYTVDISLSGETVTAGPAVFTAVAQGTEAYATMVTGDGPITYWRLGESSGLTAVDEIGFYDATYEFGPNSVLGEPGVTLGDNDTSVAFPGTTNALIEAWPDNPADVNPSVFSVEFWAVSTGGSGFRSPITSRDFISELEILGWTFYADDNNAWQFRIGQGVVTSNTAWHTIQGPGVVQNQWTQLVGTYDGSDMKFYVDGALVGMLPGVTYLPQDYNPLWIGAGLTEDENNLGGFFWVGKVDEVALYDRALTGQEVIEHYAAAFPAAVAPPEIIVDPAGISRLAGESAVFDVGVHASPPLTYQWQLGGVDIPGATDRILLIPEVQASDAGMYKVQVGNSVGFTFSAEAELEICSGLCTLPVLNGGFDDATGVLADIWNDNGGNVRGGVEGGFGWTAGYYTGGFPTDDTFATTITGPIRQDLSGRSLVEGVTYTLTVDLFSSDTYGASAGSTINWRVALTGDGETVAEDVWYSDEFQTAGETIPSGRLISITPDGGHGLTTATLVYTATAADAGKALGIELGGDVMLGATQGDDYYGHLDTVQLTAQTDAATTAMNIEWVGGNMVITWEGPGTLQEVGTLLGTWSDVIGATSPVVVIPTTPQNYFRLRE